MKTCGLSLVFALTALTSVLAGEWYVDASSASGGDGSASRPFAVIQDAVNAAGEGDTIHVAAGVYSNGVTTVSGGNSRICVTNRPSLKLVGAGRGKTVVIGSRDPAEEAFGSTEVPVRCAYVASSDGTIFTGFTFRDGEIQNGKSTCSAGNAGGGLYADSTEVYLVDCDVIHCSARYGAAAYQGTLVRCLVDGNYAVMGPGGRGVRYINSVITRSMPSAGSTATLYECKLYNATVIDNGSTWAVQTSDDEIYNSLLLLSSNKDIYRETNVICRVENSVFPTTAPKGIWQVMGPLTGDWRLLNDSDAVNAGVSSWLTGLSLPSGVDALKDFAGNTIVPDAEGRINAGAIQTVVTPAGGALAFLRPHYASVDGYVMCRADSGLVGWVYPETYPTQFCVKANLADGQSLYRVLRTDAAGYSYKKNDADPGFVPLQEGGAMHLLPPPSRTVVSTNQAVIASTVLWCDDDAYGQSGADGSEEHPFGTIQDALDVVEEKTPTVIFVKPGCYSNGVVETAAYGNFRILVTNDYLYVRIASTCGADETFIVGAPDESTLESESNPGCGANAVKGVCLRGGRNVVFQGFTVCGCYGQTSGTSPMAGVAIQSTASSPALVVDCVVSNNVSADSVCECGIYRRTVFRDNQSVVQTVSGTYVTSCFLANNTAGATADKGPMAGSGGIYNDTLVCAKNAGTLFSAGTYYNCVCDGGKNLYSVTQVTNSIVNNCKYYYGTHTYIAEDPKFLDRGVSPVVKVGSPSVGAGLVPTADNYGVDYWKAMDGDLFGNPIAFSASGAPTIGAAQRPVDFRTLTFATPANGGLATSEGATSGSFELVEGTADVVSFVPAAGTRPCAGLKIGETSYWFTNTTDNVITIGYSALSSCGATCAVEPLYTTDWYVDDDGDDSRSGMLPSLAKKTLSVAMQSCASGDTLWALPGTYDEGGELAQATHTVSNRVCIRGGVTLRSTEGPERTSICGALAPEGVRDASGCGSNAVRCVYLAGANAKVVGFTLRDGRGNLDKTSRTKDEDAYGGGVLGSSATNGRVSANGYWVVDCLITNCAAEIGAVVARACLIRSRALGNTATSSLVYQGSSYGSYLDHNVVKSYVFRYGLDIVGSTIGPDNLTSDGKTVDSSANTVGGGVFFNSLFCQPLTPGGSKVTTIRNCVCAKGSDLSANADTNETVVVASGAAQVAIDANGAPVIGSSLAVDAGDASVYPNDAYPTLDAVTDLSGSQRISNGRMDIGALEADWRPQFAATLGNVHRLAVTRADPAVVAAAGGVVISNGTVEVVWTNSREREASYSFIAEVTGAGSLAVTLNGEFFRTLTAADGAVKLEFTNALAANALAFAYAPGDGEKGATRLSRFRCALYGLRIILR